MSSYLDCSDSDSDGEIKAASSLTEEKKIELLECVQQLKKEGNDHFAKGEFERAVEIYSSAINLMKTNGLPLDAIILLNRSAAYLSLKRFVPALNDANKATELDPNNWKGHWRKGVALMSMSKRLFRTKQAMQAFESCRTSSTLPPSKQSEVHQEIMKARNRLEQQEAESPPPDLSKCTPS